MKIDDFNYELPQHLIAQVPAIKRDSSKLLVMDKKSGEISHYRFSDIINLIDNNSCVVFNNTLVIPARIIGIKEETNALIELLLLNEVSDKVWRALVKPAKRVKVGTIVKFSDELSVKCINSFDDGIKEFELIYDGILLEILEKLGSMPLPPYITAKLDDKSRYQTVYAINPGSVAAPTAGLHFTSKILEALEKKGVSIAFVTLHVGLGTFRPVAVENIDEHQMHSEYYEINKENAKIINDAIISNKKIVSVGTTSTRVLESVFIKNNGIVEDCGETSIFIYPGYKFNIVDELITNFHLPKSTLIMLVSAFSKREYILNAYQIAIENDYKFFSFGDAMYIK